MGSPEAVLDLSYLDEELTILWTLLCALFVVFMQCGFALLESGGVRSKNVKNILLKNTIDACISTLCWWSVGWAFSYGKCGQNGFIGYSNFFSADEASSTSIYWAKFFFSWAFSATATTVVSGAVAERMQFKAYAIYTIAISAFIYPLVVHWVWSSSGWLSATRRPDCSQDVYSPLLSRTNGLLDFAGSGVVHMVGGGAALMGAITLGPRLGRFNDDGSVVHFEPSSPTNMALGVFILWLGWYGFNAGSTGCFSGCMGTASMVAVNTTLAIGSSALTSLMLAVILGGAGDIGPLLNGVMAGAVSITASCAFVKAYAAFVIGIVGALVYTASAKLLLRLRIDDPLDAAPIHFFCGTWGVLAAGFFATESALERVYNYANDWGVFYGGQGYQLGVQVLGVVVIAAWSCGLSLVLFLLLKKAGWLRVPKEIEVTGLDFAQSLVGSAFSKYTAASYWAYSTRAPTPPPADSKPPGAGPGRVSGTPAAGQLLSRASVDMGQASRRSMSLELPRTSVPPVVNTTSMSAELPRPGGPPAISRASLDVLRAAGLPTRRPWKEVREAPSDVIWEI